VALRADVDLPSSVGNVPHPKRETLGRALGPPRPA